jgi:hypothetical protein
MRAPGPREIEHLSQACESIRAEFPRLELCLSIGLLGEEQARRLREAGAGWINHNLNTSRRFYPEICTTHTRDDRVRTIENVRAAGLSICSGGIVGMGETDDDVIDLERARLRLAGWGTRRRATTKLARRPGRLDLSAADLTLVLKALALAAGHVNVVVLERSGSPRRWR